MICNNPGKACCAAILVAISCLPLSAIAATSISFDFSTTILAATVASPLLSGEDVSGRVQIASGDYNAGHSTTRTEAIFGEPLTFPVSAFDISGATWGWAAGPDWSQVYPGVGIGLGLIDDYVLPDGSMNDAPDYAFTLFPNLPSDGDKIDMVLISVVSNDYGTSSLEKSFNFAFIYDAADGVVTGTDMAHVEASKLFTSLIYGNFFAYEKDLNTDTTVWEAMGPIGASAVPVPAALWLFGSGLLGLFGISRRAAA